MKEQKRLSFSTKLYVRYNSIKPALYIHLC